MTNDPLKLADVFEKKSAFCVVHGDPDNAELYAATAALLRSIPAMQQAMKGLYEQLKSVNQLPCPKDTNCDGNCGRRLCPYCGPYTDAALTAAAQFIPQEKPDAR